MNSHVEFEQLDIKHEVDPLSIVEVKIEPQEEDTQESLVKFQDDYEKKFQNKIRNGVSDIDITTVGHEAYKIYKTCLEGDKCGLSTCDHSVDEVNTCNNSLFKISNAQSTGTCRESSISNESFSQESDFTEQMYLHSGEFPFSCNFCSMMFSSKFILGIHTLTHTGEKCFTCNICNNSFTCKSHLIEHIDNIHTNNSRLFPCNICNESFSHKNTLSIHLLMHTNEKPFTCEICDKSFSDKSNLRSHANGHKRPFECDICRKSFTGRMRLIEHTRTHTNEKPFSCNFCMKTFSLKSNLTRHTAIHANEKLFSCNICSKSFCRKSVLDTHALTHADVRPFTCNFCSKSFAQKITLTRHIYRRHSKTTC